MTNETIFAAILAEAEGKPVDALRSCWKCNPAHEYLKDTGFIFQCFECWHYFYKGVDLNEAKMRQSSVAETTMSTTDTDSSHNLSPVNIRDKFIEQLSYRIESKGSVLISSQVRALAEMIADILTCESDDRIASVILDKIDPRNKG